MANDTATIRFAGDRITLGTLEQGIARFRSLMDAIALDVAGGAIDWVVDELDTSSAIATVHGESQIGSEAVERAVRAYAVVGRALSRQERPPYSIRVADAAQSLGSIINGQVQSITFETEESDWVVQSRPAAQRAEIAVPLEAYGAVTGRVQTVSSRRGLRFTLYDLLSDKAVSCYPEASREAEMRDIWGRRAVVEGWVTRDPMTGRPLSIRRITAVVIQQDQRDGTYLDARGAVELPANAILPEVAIRRLRDQSDA